MAIVPVPVPGRLAVAALCLLAGCTLGEPDAGQRPDESRFPGPPPSRMAVAQGAVIVAGPRGYCIDREASRDGGGAAALTVLSPCRQLGGGPFGPRPDHSAVLTAAVAPDDRTLDIAAAGTALAGFFASDAGRAALSRSGAAATVAVQESFAEGDAWLLHLSDTAPFAWGAVQAEYWRALLPAGGRMVTLAVLTLPEAPLTREAGLALLRDFVAALRDSTPAGQNTAG